MTRHPRDRSLPFPLAAETAGHQAPAEFAPSKAISLDEISRYDSRGPAWYWNNISCGEHTGTHFDAPFTGHGKDYPQNATHNIPVSAFIGPACGDQRGATGAGDADFC